MFSSHSPLVLSRLCFPLNVLLFYCPYMLSCYAFALSPDTLRFGLIFCFFPSFCLYVTLCIPSLPLSLPLLFCAVQGLHFPPEKGINHQNLLSNNSLSCSYFFLVCSIIYVSAPKKLFLGRAHTHTHTHTSSQKGHQPNRNENAFFMHNR